MLTQRLFFSVIFHFTQNFLKISLALIDFAKFSFIMKLKPVKRMEKNYE